MTTTSSKDYLDGLKAEHRAVERMFTRVDDHLRAGQNADAARELRALRAALTAHLRKEDERLYVELLGSAQEQPGSMIGVTVNTFTTAMRGIGARAERFFSRCAEPGALEAQGGSLREDFDALWSDLARRIRSEEGTLYPLYEKHCARSADRR